MGHTQGLRKSETVAHATMMNTFHQRTSKRPKSAGRILRQPRKVSSEFPEESARSPIKNVIKELPLPTPRTNTRADTRLIGQHLFGAIRYE